MRKKYRVSEGGPLIMTIDLSRKTLNLRSPGRGIIFQGNACTYMMDFTRNDVRFFVVRH